MNINRAVSLMEARLQESSRRERIPGLTPSEIHAEMLECLWNATQNYDHKRNPNFEAWFFLMWNQHKSRYLRWYFAQKRAAMDTVFTQWEDDSTHPLVPGADHFSTPEVPSGSTDVEVSVWHMIANGWRPSEVREVMSLSLFAYYKIIHKWRKVVILDDLDS